MESVQITAEQALELLRESGQQKVKVAITDIDGVLRGKYIHARKFASALESGFGFCNVVLGWDAADVAYDNADYTGWHTGYPDAAVQLDLRSLRRVPWDEGVPFVLGDFVDAAGAGLPVCPRQLLRRVIQQADDLDLIATVGMEFEWFNFRETAQTLRDKGFHKPEPITPGMFGYSLLRSSQNQSFFTAIMDELAAFSVPVEGLHTETGPGVFEAAILCSDALEAADRGVLFKASVKEIGQRFGILPSFMAKWQASLPGCSGHIHQSLRRKSGESVFFDTSDPLRMSPTFKHYLAGQMHCMAEILPCFAPTVNSYKRLVEGAWAPTRINWGADNRTVALRVIPGSAKSTRLETRVPGSDVNPYIAVAAALASGLYGIKHKLELPRPAVTGNGYRDEKAPTLPRNLGEAAEAMRRSELAQTLFGTEFVAHFTATREWEWRQYQAAVTNWERERYFEII